MHETAISLPVILPEAVLAAGTLALVLYGALRGERGSALVNEIAVGLLGLVFILLVARNRPMGITFYGSFTDDAFTRFMSALALVGSLVTLLLSVEFMRQERIGGFEFPVLILISTLGMLMLISANDFIALYLGFELMSLALYVIAAYRRHDLRATEAGLKYFVLGALSSGMMLYGMSLIYGYSGSVAFGAVANAVHDHANVGVLFGLVSCRFTCGRPTFTRACRPR
jgi:NADH-quinone oxidoreductase subunit N